MFFGDSSVVAPIERQLVVIGEATNMKRWQMTVPGWKSSQANVTYVRYVARFFPLQFCRDNGVERQEFLPQSLNNLDTIMIGSKRI